MSVYAEIVQWSANLPLWQRDALRRLVAGAVGQSDVEALASMCLAESSQRAMAPILVPLDVAQVPTVGGDGSTVSLLAVTETSSINALVDNQTLTFGPAGITIVYGDNGAGKSGFARVLRQVCQARGPSSPVLSNVYAHHQGSPRATVTYQVNGVDLKVTWSPSAQAPAELGRVAVFDSVAATEFVEKENVILWTPGGLDLLERLAGVVDAVQQRLEQAASAVAAQGPLPQPQFGTGAFAFLQGLKATTPLGSVDALLLGPEEEAELQRLDAAVSTQEPAVVAAQFRQRAQRFRALGGRIAPVEIAFGQSGLQQLQRLRESYDAAVAAEQLLARQTFGDSTLPGVGEAPWQALWTAAEAYAYAGATPDHAFPSAQEPALCVLCQQQLTTDARSRLTRFHKFVRADVAQRRAAAAAAWSQMKNELRSLRTREAADGALIAEVSTINAEHGTLLSAFLDQAHAVHEAIVRLDLAQPSWVLPSPLPLGWPAWIENLAGSVDREAQVMEPASNPETRAAQVVRRNELQARKVLLEGRVQVETEINRLGNHAAIRRAAQSCATTGITRKAGELTKAYVSDLLVSLFAAESQALRLPHTVSYSPARNEKGTSYQRVMLSAASWAARSGAPVQVLSEGERRAIALAAFLAELGTRNDKSTVVLDDPVSSLDHERRNIVAHRLAECARDRQVIVFTHDLVFVHMLKAAAGKHGVGVTDREIRRVGTTAGYCRNKTPAKAMTVKALVGELKAHQQECAAQHRDGELDAYERHLTQGYGLLREAWERAVEELLFNQSVMRFDHRVQTQRLKPVHDICQADVDTIDAGMTVCSKWLPGHAQALAINEPLPGPPDFLAEIQRLEVFVQAMRQRGRT